MRVSGVAATETREKPPARQRGGLRARKRKEFRASNDVLVFLSLVSIAVTMLYFRDVAVWISSQFGGMLSSWVSGLPSQAIPLSPSIFSFPGLGEVMAILGSVVLTSFSTVRLHQETSKIPMRVSFFDAVVGMGFLGGFMTFLILRKHVFLVLTAIGTVFILATFGGAFVSGGAKLEEVLVYCVVAALPLVFATIPLLVVLTLIMSTLSNTMAGIYCYLGSNRNRE